MGKALTCSLDRSVPNGTEYAPCKIIGRHALAHKLFRMGKRQDIFLAFPAVLVIAEQIALPKELVGRWITLGNAPDLVACVHFRFVGLGVADRH